MSLLRNPTPDFPMPSHMSATVWLAVGNDCASRKETLVLDDAEEIGFDEEMITRQELDLVVEFNQEDSRLGMTRVALGRCPSKEGTFSLEVKCPFTGMIVSAEVGPSNIFAEDSGQNSEHRLADSIKERKQWLELLETYALTWKGWAAATVFLKYFEPAHKIALEAFDKQSQIPWLVGRTENLVAGPAIVYAVHVNIAGFVFYCSVVVIFGFVVLPGCAGEGPHAPSLVPAPWTFYLFYAVPALLKIYCGLAVMGCVLPVKVLGGGVPKLPDIMQKLSFGQSSVMKLWLVMKLLGSLAAGLDVFSSSIFLSRVIASEAIARRHQWTLEEPWLRSLQVSKVWVWDSIARALGGYPTFQFMVFLLWLIVIVQILWALAYSLPVSRELQESERPQQRVLYDFRPFYTRTANSRTQGETDDLHRRKSMCIGDWYVPLADKMMWFFYTVRCALMQSEQPGAIRQRKTTEQSRFYTDFAEYHTPLISYQVHGRALVALLKSARLSMGQAMDTEYVVHMAKHWKPKDVYDYQRQSGHLFIIFMIQRVLMTSLQASFLGISENLPEDSPDLLTLMNVLLGCALGLATIYSEVSLNFQLAQVVWRRKQSVTIEEDTQTGMQYSKRSKRDLFFHRFWSGVSLVITSSFAFFSIVSFWYCIMKAFAAFYCDCGMMNLDMLSGLKCVEFNGTSNCTMSNWTVPANISAHFSHGLSPGYMKGSIVCSTLRL